MPAARAAASDEALSAGEGSAHGGGHSNSHGSTGGTESSSGAGFRAALVLNKVDLVTEQQRLPQLAERLSEAAGDVFADVFATSALKGQGVQELRQYLYARATPSEWLPDTAASSDDLSAAADLAVELVKEQLFLRLSGELPYVLQPVTTGAKRFPDGGVLFTQTIFVRSEPVRGILIGAGGSVIGHIGMRARRQLEAALGTRVSLYLTVVVRKEGASETSQLMSQSGA